MKTIRKLTANDFSQDENLEKRVKPTKSFISRRSFLGKSLAVGAGTIGAGLLASTRTAKASVALTSGDAAMLRFAAAAEILETDFWVQYNELGGVQDNEVPGGTGNRRYTGAIEVLDEDIPTLGVNQHTAIPRTDADTTDRNFLQAIANTAAFHFATIEQGGTSLYPAQAQRATSVEVLRILISIGPTETMHFQTWSDKAGNAPALTAVDPVPGVSVSFPDLNSPPFGGEDFQTNLIMPEPCPFLSRKLPVVSIIRPTQTRGIAMGVVSFLTAMGLFIGQSPEFFAFMRDLAEDADEARRGIR